MKLLRDLLVLVLINLLVLPPMTFAGGITPDPKAPAGKRPGMDAAQNGVPIVNIATPNKSGLSHNQYKDFNVQKQGAILNNSKKAGVSQLGGAIAGNPNVAKGGHAKTILNEVTSANRSHIQGYIEVFGQKADVILANPNGITVNGGGFINTGRATLTTGRPVVENDMLKSFDVRGGTVSVEGAGINASNITGFDIVARAAEINAEIHAGDLSIVTGQNSYDVSTRMATATASDGTPAPSVAIDSSSLGGMYAGRITLTSTEKGVGVNLDGVMQATGDLEITADGKLVARAAKSGGDMKLASLGDSVNVKEAAVSGGNMNMKAAKDVTLPYAESQRDMNLAAGTVVSVKQAGAQGSVSLSAGETVNIGESLFAGQDFAIKTDVFSLEGAELAVRGTLKAEARELSLKDSTVTASGAVTIDARSLWLAEQSLLASGSHFSFAGNDLKLTDNSVIQGNDVAVNTATVSLDKGNILAGNDLSVTATELDSKNGALLANRDLTLAVTRFSSTGDSVESLNGLDVSATGGSLYAGRNLTLGGGDYILSGGFAGAAGDLLFTNKNLSVRGNTGMYGGRSLSFNLAEKLNITGGALTIGGDADISAGSIHLLDGSLSATGELALRSGGDVSIDATGGLFGHSGLTLAAQTILNKGILFSGADMFLHVANTLTNSGGADILAVGDMWFEGESAGSRMAKLHNEGSSIESLEGDITIRADLFHNDGGKPEIVVREVDSKKNVVIGWGPIEEYLETVEKIYGIPADNHARKSSDWRETTSLTETITLYREEVAGTSSPSSLAAAGDITVEAESVRNILSDISAGNNISIKAERLENRGLELSEVASFDRFFYSHYISHRDTSDDSPVNVWAEKTVEKSYNGIKKVYGSVASTISAVGELFIDAVQDVDNNSLKFGEDNYVGKHTGSVFGRDTIGVLQGEGFGGQPGYPKLNIPIPSGIFSYANNAGHPYLIETNPRLTSMGTFFGSEYFFSRMGVDIAGISTKLLGDAFYETRLVREQILAQAGVRFLYPGVTDDGDMMRLLLDGAALEGTRLSLSVGVSLTPEQVKNLTTDIVWLEEQMVNGQKVLVPRLYLCDATRENVSSSGANLAGNDVVINTGTFKNSGSLAGATVQLATTGDVLNRGGSMKGSSDLFVDSGGSIINQSGSIGGGDVILVATEDIRIETASQKKHSDKYNSYDAVSNQADVTAAGTLRMDAGKNISLTGAKLNAQDSAVFTAGGDIDINSLGASVSHGGKRPYNTTSEQTEHIGSTLMSGENITLISGNNIGVRGSMVSAMGDALIAADGNITVHAEKDSHYANRYIRGHSESISENIVGAGISAGGKAVLDAGNNILLAGSHVSGDEAAVLRAGNDITLTAVATTDKSKKDNWQGKSSKTTVTQHGSSVSGGDVLLQAGNNIGLVASGIHADNEAALEAGGNITMTTAENMSKSYKKKTSSGGLFGTSSSSVKKTKEITNVGSSVTAGGDLSIRAGLDSSKGTGSIVMEGSNAIAGGNALLSATGNVVLNSVQNIKEKSSSKSSRSLFSSSKKTSSSYEETNVGSFVGAGNDLTIVAGENVGVTASGLAAGNNLTVAAITGDVVFASAQDVKESRTKKSTSGFGIMPTSSGVDFYQSSKTKKSEYSSESVGSSVMAGNDITISAGRDVTAIHTNVLSGNDLTVGAGRDVNIMPGVNDYSSSYSKKKTGIGISVSGSSEFGIPTGGSVFAGVKTSERREKEESLKNVGSSMHAGGNMNISAGENINVLASGLSAGKNMELDAGGDLNILSAYDRERTETFVRETQYGLALQAQQSYTSAAVKGFESLNESVKGNNEGKGGTPPRIESPGAYVRFGLTGSDSSKSTTYEKQTPVSSTLVANENLSLKAGNDFTMIGGNIKAGEDVAIGAGRNVDISSAKTTTMGKSSSKSTNWNLDADGLTTSRTFLTPGGSYSTSKSSSKTTVVVHENPSTIEGQNVTIVAGNDLGIKHGMIGAKKDIDLQAGNDISIGTAENSVKSSSRSTSWGFDTLQGKAGYSSSKTSTKEYADTGSILLAEGAMNVQAGRDIDVQGSRLVSKDNMDIVAGRDITVSPGEVSKEATERHRKITIGSDDGFSESKVDSFSGLRWHDSKSSSSSSLPYGSEFYSEKDINVTAGRDLTMAGAKVEAEGDAALIAGRDLSLLAMESRTRSKERTVEIAAGAFAEVSQSVTGTLRGIGKSVNQSIDKFEKAREASLGANVESGKMLLETGQDIYNTGKKVVNTAMGLAEGKGVKVDYTVGGKLDVEYSNKSASSLAQKGATLKAGNDILLASGQDIIIQGGEVAATRDLDIDAGRDIKVSPIETYQKSSSTGVKANARLGLGGSYGTDGFTVIGVKGSAGAEVNTGSMESTVHTNAKLSGGRDTNVVTGRDAEFKGANISGDSVTMDIGRNLTVESVRDEYKSSSTKSGAQIGGSFGLGGGFSVDSASAEFSFDNKSGKSVGEQASIVGKNKVDITVGNNTHLEGGLIASESNDLRLDTGSLSWNDMKSKTTNTGGTASIKYSPSREEAKKKTEPTDNMLSGINKGIQDINKVIQSSPVKPGKLGAKFNESTQTVRGTIGEGQIIVRDNPGADLSGLNRDPSKAVTVKDSKWNFDQSISNPFGVINDIADGVNDADRHLQGIKDHKDGITGYVEEKVKNSLNNLSKRLETIFSGSKSDQHASATQP